MRIGQTSIIYFFSKFGSSIAGFVATLYIARMLGADVYGSYMLALAVLGWLKIGGKVGLSGAITKRTSEHDEPDAYLVTGLGMMGAIFLLAAIAAVVLRDPIESYIGAPVLPILLILLAAELFRAFTAAALQGQHLVHVYAILDPINVTTRTALQIGAIVVGFGLGGLLAAYAFASISLAFVGLLFISFTLVRPTLRHAKSLYNYAKYSWLGNLRTMSFMWVDVTILGFFVSTTLIGIYSVTWSIAALLTIFGKGISSTLFPEISKISAQSDPSKVSNLITDATRYNGLIMFPGLVGAAILGERILLVYGSEFTIGLSILLILIVARIFYGYQKQFVTTINGINRPEIAFRINAVFIGSNALLNFILIWQLGWVGAAIATTIASMLTLVYAYYAVRQFISFEIPYTDIAHQCLAAVAMGTAVYAMVLLGPAMEDSIQGHLTTVLFVGAGATFYFSILLGISAQFRTTVLSNLPFDIPFVR